MTRRKVNVRFRPNARIPKGADADKVAGELGRIYREAGELVPGAVVEAAADTRSPLHAAFPAYVWNDAEAAEQHRLWWARHLIGSVMVTITRADGREVPARQFLHIDVRRAVPTEEAEGSTYIPIRRVLNREELRQGQIARALDEIGRLLSRWQFLPELDPLHITLDRIRARHLP